MDFFLDFIFIISLTIMGVSVILILIMVSRKVKHSDIDNQGEFGLKEVECPEPVFIDEDFDNHYENFKYYKITKNDKKGSNDFSDVTAENSAKNIYSYQQKNGLENQKLENHIYDFIKEGEKNIMEGKVYHKKDEFFII